MSSVDLRTLETKIDSLIREGEATKAHCLISRLLKLAEYSPESRLSASEFLRRISRHEEALRILRTEIKVAYNSKLSEIELRIYVQTLRLLNSLGASEFALKAIAQYPKDIQLKFSATFSEIYLSNYYYEEAYELLMGLEKQDFKKLTYPERLKVVSIIDCWNGSERFQDSIKLIEKLLEHSPEPVLQGILHQVMSTSQIGIGNPRKALTHLKQAEQKFEKDQSTFDSAFVSKWYGIAYTKLKEYDLAISYFSKAWKVLYRPGYKPEGWLELLYYVGLARFEKNKKISQEWRRLLAYPGPNRRFIDQITKVIIPQTEFYFTLESSTQKKELPLIDLASDTSLRKSGQKEQYSIGLNATDHVHYWLLVAGKYGIPYYRFFDILWESETFSCTQFQKRFEQILIRLRRDKITVEMDQHHLHLQKTSIYAFWNGAKSIRGKPFLELHINFERKDVEKFFDISPRSALSMCQEWLEKGLVIKTKSGYGNLGM